LQWLWTATFVEASPQEISYRIEIAKKNHGMEEERIQLSNQVIQNQSFRKQMKNNL